MEYGECNESSWMGQAFTSPPENDEELYCHHRGSRKKNPVKIITSATMTIVERQSMAKRALRGMLGGLLVPFFTFTVLAQGLSFEVLQGNGNKGGEKVIYMPGMFRQEDKDGHIGIVRLDKEMFISINPAEKTYTEVTFAQMEKKVKQGRAMGNEAMKKRLEGMPPEQRKMIEERMAGTTGQRDETKTEVAATGEQKVIEGYRCTRYIVKHNGKELERIWATKEVPNFTSVRKDFQRIGSFFASMGARSTMAWIEKVDGFPIERSGTGTSEKITKIQQGSFPKSAFEIPQGYTKTKSQLEEGGQ